MPQKPSFLYSGWAREPPRWGRFPKMFSSGLPAKIVWPWAGDLRCSLEAAKQHCLHVGLRRHRNPCGFYPTGRSRLGAERFSGLEIAATTAPKKGRQHDDTHPRRHDLQQCEQRALTITRHLSGRGVDDQSAAQRPNHTKRLPWPRKWSHARNDSLHSGVVRNTPLKASTKRGTQTWHYFANRTR